MAIKSTTWSEIQAVSGDWFIIATEYVSKDKAPRISMERVVSWVGKIVTYDKDMQEAFVYAIGSSGYAMDDEYLEREYVSGSDLAPDGRTWLEVYNAAPHFNMTFKLISDIAQEWNYVRG